MAKSSFFAADAADEPVAGDVVFDVAFAEVGAVFQAGELAKPHARLRPVGFGAFGGGIVGGEFKSDLVGSGSDGVIDNDTVGEDVAELYRCAVIAEGDELVLVIDDGVPDPIGIGGLGAAVGLEVVDEELVVGRCLPSMTSQWSSSRRVRPGFFLGGFWAKKRETPSWVRRARRSFIE